MVDSPLHLSRLLHELRARAGRGLLESGRQYWDSGLRLRAAAADADADADVVRERRAASCASPPLRVVVVVSPRAYVPAPACQLSTRTTQLTKTWSLVLGMDGVVVMDV